MTASEKDHHSAREAAHAAMECLTPPDRFPKSILWNPDLTQIIRALRLLGPASNAEVSIALGLSPSLTRHHLETLRATGLVTKTTLHGGRHHTVQYELNRDAVLELSAEAEEVLVNPGVDTLGEAGVSFWDLVRAYIQDVGQQFPECALHQRNS